MDRGVAADRLGEGDLAGPQQRRQVVARPGHDDHADVSFELDVHPREAVRSPDAPQCLLRRPDRAVGEGRRCPVRARADAALARGQRRGRQEAGEAVAADPGPEGAIGPPGRFEHGTRPVDELLTRRVTHALHDLTETADLQQEHGDRLPAPGSRREQRVPAADHPGQGAQPGQRIGVGRRPHPVHQVPDHQCGRHRGGRGQQQRHPVLPGAGPPQADAADPDQSLHGGGPGMEEARGVDDDPDDERREAHRLRRPVACPDQQCDQAAAPGDEGDQQPRRHPSGQQQRAGDGHRGRRDGRDDRAVHALVVRQDDGRPAEQTAHTEEGRE